MRHHVHLLVVIPGAQTGAPGNADVGRGADDGQVVRGGIAIEQAKIAGDGIKRQPLAKHITEIQRQATWQLGQRDQSKQPADTRRRGVGNTPAFHLDPQRAIQVGQRKRRWRARPTTVNEIMGLAAIDQASKTEHAKHGSQIVGGKVDAHARVAVLRAAIPVATGRDLHVFGQRPQLFYVHAVSRWPALQPRFTQPCLAQSQIIDPQMQRRQRRGIDTGICRIVLAHDRSAGRPAAS